MYSAYQRRVHGNKTVDSKAPLSSHKNHSRMSTKPGISTQSVSHTGSIFRLAQNPSLQKNLLYESFSKITVNDRVREPERFRKISIYDKAHSYMIDHYHHEKAWNKDSIAPKIPTGNLPKKAAEPSTRAEMIQYIRKEMNCIKGRNELKKYDLVSSIQTLPAYEYRKDGYLNSSSKKRPLEPRSAIYTQPSKTRSHIVNLPGSGTSLTETHYSHQPSFEARNLCTSVELSCKYGFRPNMDIGTPGKTPVNRSRCASISSASRSLNRSQNEYDIPIFTHKKRIQPPRSESSFRIFQLFQGF
eukprot:TRINITY_DN9008_c0_g2_i1.p2 TRINITY_DN9008_c0_g2~~TRINITY_DN9008_c0_g2_i1.p2  ORF type:complete len:300 (-),score=12.86 TRINITY_DN9008_c0_g2_i1:46-945(-)